MFRNLSHVIWLLSTTCLAAAAVPTPEIARPPAPPATTGALHVVRTIPEACVRLEGRFGADPAAPYALTTAPRLRCQPRARFVETSGDDEAGWILNDRIEIPRADRADCVAVVSVWRHPGDLAQARRDAQQRVRMYLDQKTAAAQLPRFRADVQIAPACGE